MAKLKYKVGDKVRVRSWEDMKDQYGLLSSDCIPVRKDVTFVKDMRKYCGEEVVIRRVLRDCYLIEGDSWYWTDEMFESKDKYNTIVIYTKENQVIALDKATGKTGIAICSPEDRFNFYVGADLAFNRLRGRLRPPKERGPKYYNGKIVCVNTDAANLTVGKIYKVKNGKFLDDFNKVHGAPYPYISFKDLNDQHFSCFVEVVR